VGIDPVWERLPAAIRSRVDNSSDERRARAHLEAIREYVASMFEVVAPHVPCVKLQSACFERYHGPGVVVYDQLIAMARGMNLIVIGDAKRGDIGISASHYAAGCLADSNYSDLGNELGPDALTINSYFGDDGIAPFVKVAAEQGKGLFALVRTSNPGGDAIQQLQLADGRRVCDAVAEVVAKNGSNHVGKSGYSLLGAVVGATKPEDAARLRELMPQQIFLVPGFGAQGGSADDVRACFKSDGSGAIITASRSIIYAYEKSDEKNWLKAVEAATVDMKRQVAAILQ
jgi:orotidine-5'-phosphate decarboxylase